MIYGSQTWTRFARKNGDENVEMNDGYKEDREDQEWGNKSKGRCRKQK